MHGACVEWNWPLDFFVVVSKEYVSAWRQWMSDMPINKLKTLTSSWVTCDKNGSQHIAMSIIKTSSGLVLPLNIFLDANSRESFFCAAREWPSSSSFDYLASAKIDHGAPKCDLKTPIFPDPKVPNRHLWSWFAETSLNSIHIVGGALLNAREQVTK